MGGFNDLFKQIADFFVDYWFNIVAALSVLVIGGILISLLAKLIMKIIYATKFDNASGGFFVAILKVVLWVLLMFSCASILGIDGNSFLVAFSSVALAVGLALKDSLANIANGIVIIVNKPFKKGDYVSIGSTEGTIKKITILTTELTTGDNKRIVVPNSTVSTSTVINYSSNPTRRLEMIYSVSYDSDMKKVKEILYNVVANYEYTLKTPAPFIFMSAHSASSVDFKVRIWVDNIDYWNAYFGLNEKVFEAFKANNIEIPYNKLDVNIIETASNKE
ncbi:MAG: mechanosensitive ion channel [Acholeplasmatales bacterium]|nr:mechanosensitive ion channel [Acholeplasmatales bacterium]